MSDSAVDNRDSYRGAKAVEEWSADRDLYEQERVIIARHFPPAPARVLDVGCGAGRTTTGLEELGYDVDALDLSEDLAAEARTRVTRSRIHVMDARQLAFPDGELDAVLFSFNGLDCLHPTSARLEVLREIHRVLRPGGVFYYSGHNGLAMFMPRPGDSIGQVVRRNQVFLGAQRQHFADRTRYLAYPDAHGHQVLHSALPTVHLRELDALGFDTIAIYGSRNFRAGPHLLDNAAGTGLAARWQLARISVLCPHVHYVTVKR